MARFDTLAIAGPLGGRRVDSAWDRATVDDVLRSHGLTPREGSSAPIPLGGRAGFDISLLPFGVGYSESRNPRRGYSLISATIPAAKRMKDGTVRTAGTSGVEGLSVKIGSWGTEAVEYATVQVSAKALHDGSNVESLDERSTREAVDLAFEHLVGLGYRGTLKSALMARADSVIDFSGVERHGRYVAALYDRHQPRGWRRVGHGHETLAAHGPGGMLRLYDKTAESGGPVGRSRFELERHRGWLREKLGVSTVGDFLEDGCMATMDDETRAVFEDHGCDQRVAPLSNFLVSLLTCDAPLDRDGEELCGYGPTVRRGAAFYAVMSKLGLAGEVIDPSAPTLRKYRRLYDAAGVSMEEASLVDAEDGMVWLDLHTETERREA